MATDPVKRVRRRTHDTELDLDVRDGLVRLAGLPPSPIVPYVTVALDWRPQGGDPGRAPAAAARPSQRRADRDESGVSRRPGRQQIERDLLAALAEFGPRDQVRDELEAALAEILAYLDDELDPAAQGVFIVAGGEEGVFEPLALGLPVETAVSLGPVPALFALARLVDDYPPHAVLVADQMTATLSIFSKTVRGKSLSVESTGFPRKQASGGISQQNYQARANERIAATARVVAAEVESALADAEVRHLVVAGVDETISALTAAASDRLKQMTDATIRLDLTASETEIVEATMPIVEQAEREREAATVAALRDALGSGSRGLAGADLTLRAFRQGGAATLVVVDDFAAAGWADFSMAMSGVGAIPAEHPLGGDHGAIVAVQLEDEFIRMAIATGAAIEIVRSAVPVAADPATPIPEPGQLPRSAAAAALDEVGGVGALLRFDITQAPMPEER